MASPKLSWAQWDRMREAVWAGGEAWGPTVTVRSIIRRGWGVRAGHDNKFRITKEGRRVLDRSQMPAVPR